MPRPKHAPGVTAGGRSPHSRPSQSRPSQSRPGTPGGVSHAHEVDARALLHELRVHQIELEAQNEELRRARVETDVALRIYTEIFEFSPLGYATLHAGHVISDVNHAGAQILGRARSLLCGANFERLVAVPSRFTFGESLRTAQSSGEKQRCDIDMLRSHGELFPVRLSAIPLLRSEPTLLLAFEASSATQQNDV